jgi:hypothetical protein
MDERLARISYFCPHVSSSPTFRCRDSVAANQALHIYLPEATIAPWDSTTCPLPPFPFLAHLITTHYRIYGIVS